MGIMNAFFQTGDEFHIYIKDPAAFITPDMAVVMNPVIEAVRAARNFQPSNLPYFGKKGQIAIHRGFADGGVLLCNFFINLICCCMTPEFSHCFQNQCPLNGITVFHAAHPYLFLFLNSIIYY